MPLDYHISLDARSTFTTQGPQATKSKLNENFDICEANEQNIEDAFEDSFHDLCGDGVISGMVPSYTTGLQLSVSSGYALIGRIIPWNGGTVAVLANADPGYIFYAQDGTFHVDLDNTPPSDKSSFLYATYTSDGSDILSVTRQNRLVLPKLKSISDTIENILVTDSSADYHVDHSALGSILIQGYLDLQLSNPEAFFIEQLYPQTVSDDSDTENSPPHATTPTGFWIRITRKAGYSYSDAPTVDLTYTRYGLGYE